VPASSSKADQNPTDAMKCIKSDPRLNVLQRFFRKSDCPAERLSDVFLFEADEHKLDWRLLPSLAMVESGGGKAYRRNNVFGWANGDVFFSTISEGIHQVADRLTNSRFYRNKTLLAKLQTYNPNAGYAEKVQAVMSRISPTVVVSH
jgi:hypothetical protein